MREFIVERIDPFRYSCLASIYLLTAAHKTDLASRVERVTKSAETALAKTLDALEVTQ